MKKTTASGKESKLWFLRYVGFGVGAVGMDLSYGMFNSFLTKYLTDVLLLNASFLIIIPPLARIWDGVNDPMMGTICDNTKSRFGKFRPWILTGAVLNAVVLTLLFTNPGFEKNSAGLYIYAAAMYFLWDMTNTLADIPYWSMVPALTSDPQKRNIVSAVPRFFSGAGQLLIVVLTVKMVDFLGRGSEAAGYSRWAMVCGAVLIAGALVTVTSTKEKGALPPEEKFTLKTAVKTIAANDQLLIFMAVAIAFNTGWYLTNAMGIYYFDNVMGDKGLLAYFGMVAGAGQALGLFALPVLSRKWERRRVIQGAMILTFAAYIGMLLSGNVGKSFVPFAVFGLAGSAGVGCMFVAQTAMLADIVDYGEYKLGRRSESIVFSMKGFLQKLAYTIQSVVIALGLKLSGYDGALVGVAQGAGAKSAITFMMLGLPPVFIALSFLLFSTKYKLHGSLSASVAAFASRRKDEEKAAGR